MPAPALKRGAAEVSARKFPTATAGWLDTRQTTFRSASREPLHSVSGTVTDTPLELLLQAMQSDDPKRSEWAWGECYRQFHQKVWARVFYVIRSVAWLKEPAEATSDITSEVFVSLPSAVRKYQNIGRAEQWLMCVAVRKALRYKESITGSWSQGRNMAGKKDVDARYGVRRVRVDLEGAVEQAMVYLDSVEERDCRIELSRRLGSWSKNPSKQRWVAFVKLFLEGYGHAEIAGRLGITPATSRTWLWKIRQELGSVFQPRNELA